MEIMSNYDLNEMLPHEAPMLFIDDIKEVDMEHETLTSIVKIHRNKLFYDKKLNGVNSVAGIEYMAQTIGCYAYFKNNMQKPKIGLLLGTKLYNNKIEVFPNGEEYNVKVQEVFSDNEIVVFDCLMYDKNGEEVASATINAYQGDNVEELLKSE